MVNWTVKKSYDCRDLAEIVRILRHPGGCPWDQEQTHQSIRRNFLEEAYEAAEAIDQGDTDGLKEELGDVLLQVYFHTSIEEDAGRFTLDDVADGVCKKLIYRHPHVFGDVSVGSTGEVLSNWEELKKKEKHQSTQADVLELKDLKPGMVLTGTVRNVVDFGAFVDIGVHQDGLVHISQLSDSFVRSPSQVVKVGDIVNVTVLEVDEKKKRIALTMKKQKAE